MSGIMASINLDAFKKRNKLMTDVMITQIHQAIDRGIVKMHSTMALSVAKGPKTGATYLREPGKKYMIIYKLSAGKMVPVAFIPGGGKQNKSAIHVASAPGEAPATDTGGLIRSIRIAALKRTSKKMGSPAIISIGAPYAKFLEFGTKGFTSRTLFRTYTNKGIAPRPFIRPAFAKFAPEIIKDCRDVLNRLAKLMPPSAEGPKK